MTAFCCFHTGFAICYKRLLPALSFGRSKNQKDGFRLILLPGFCAEESNQESTFLNPSHTTLVRQAVGITR